VDATKYKKINKKKKKKKNKEKQIKKEKNKVYPTFFNQRYCYVDLNLLKRHKDKKI